MLQKISPGAGALARFIDHTLLKPDALRADILRVCDEAVEHGFFSVCVNGVHARAVAERLQGSAVKTCVVIGFPLGAMSTVAKVAETRDAIASGADEIDMVLDIGGLKDGDLDRVRADIAAVKQACGERVLKVIFETCLLTVAEKETACRLSVEAGADFVKTSTGFGKSGATAQDIALMRRTVGDRAGVKASGGVRNRDDALGMIEAGATRIGTSNGIAIVGGGTAAAGSY
ncbi:deoxyribose-phosphate aldolase [Faunimonas pinastri]|uniref:Deoxyribose-phosphate aldolase n=1 Tax=Faunimonas pinastri TaxID=1855383 RepID=A0A1H9NHJ8_9HYPH|nr:deoxyribose-phosphate aldolase [Faunimonas pinastri]SER35454.1 deoxyribose-phosphate aldolase [Faunimonas pinastri]